MVYAKNPKRDYKSISSDFEPYSLKIGLNPKDRDITFDDFWRDLLNQRTAAVFSGRYQNSDRTLTHVELVLTFPNYAKEPTPTFYLLVAPVKQEDVSIKAASLMKSGKTYEDIKKFYDLTPKETPLTLEEQREIAETIRVNININLDKPVQK